MKKDFEKWHKKKTDIDNSSKRLFFHEREVWFCSIGMNIGYEQDGSGNDFIRPVVIIRKFNNEIFWGVPLTKTRKKIKKQSEKFYYKFSFLENVASVAILSQIRLVDAKRLIRHIGTMKEENFSELTKKLKDLIPWAFCFFPLSCDRVGPKPFVIK